MKKWSTAGHKEVTNSRDMIENGTIRATQLIFVQSAAPRRETGV
jgi:hypothetical protein